MVKLLIIINSRRIQPLIVLSLIHFGDIWNLAFGVLDRTNNIHFFFTHPYPPPSLRAPAAHCANNSQTTHSLPFLFFSLTKIGQDLIPNLPSASTSVFWKRKKVSDFAPPTPPHTPSLASQFELWKLQKTFLESVWGGGGVGRTEEWWKGWGRACMVAMVVVVK